MTIRQHSAENAIKRGKAQLLYDPVGRETKRMLYDGGVQSTFYDAAGLAVVNAWTATGSSQRTAVTYDCASRRTRRWPRTAP